MNTDQGGEMLVIQGIKCYIPPQPAPEEIQNYHLPVKKQRWSRTLLPEFRAADVEFWDGKIRNPDLPVSWEEAERQEQIKIYGVDPKDLDKNGNAKKVQGVTPDPNYSMECLNRHRDQELDRFHKGHWIYIKGKAYYLPGNYYFYLNYWQLKDGYAEFRYTDLELFYFWESVKHSRNLFGIIYITMRGVGKSYIAGCINYYCAVTKRKASTTIQSKNDDDAGLFFRDKVLMPITFLPRFLVPINKHGIKDITSNSSFEMVPPPRGGMTVEQYDVIKNDALYSKMMYHPSGEVAADGPTWDLIVQEEIGKTPPSVADVQKRIQVVYFTVFRGNKKQGNIFASSTIEEMKEGGEQCLKVYLDSNQYKLNAANSTNSGLARFFRSAIDTTFFDYYGFPVPGEPGDEDTRKYLIETYGPEAAHGSRAFHDAKRASLAHDPKALIGYKQKNPYNEEEAFWINADTCVYNSEILMNAKDRILNGGRVFVRPGYIRWKNREKKEEEGAEFVEDPNGPWRVSYLDFEPNQVKFAGVYNGVRCYSPMMGHRRRFGIDPYATKDLADPKSGSMGAGVVVNMPDMLISEDYSETIIADYLGRPEDPFDFYEDMICAAFFFGCTMFIEKNKSNMMDYLRKRGYYWGRDANPEDFVMERPRSTLSKFADKESDGIHNSQSSIEHYTNSTDAHIRHHGHKLKHIRVIDQWIKFNPLKTKLTDLAVAASLAVVAMEKTVVKESDPIDIGELFGTFDNRGSESVWNQTDT